MMQLEEARLRATAAVRADVSAPSAIALSNAAAHLGRHISPALARRQGHFARSRMSALGSKIAGDLHARIGIEAGASPEPVNATGFDFGQVREQGSEVMVRARDQAARSVEELAVRQVLEGIR